MYYIYGITVPTYRVYRLYDMVKVVIIVGSWSTLRTLAPQLQTRLGLRVALDLDSDKFRSFNHREELDSACTAHGVCYI